MEKLRAAHEFSWKATARLHIGGTLDLAMHTRVRPYSEAYSESWILAKGPSQRRSMSVDARGGSMTIGGKTSPMPVPTAAHERAQFALYGLMKLDTWCEARIRAVPSRNGLEGFTVEHAGAPATTFWFDVGGRLVAAENTVPSPDGKAAIAQSIRFSGSVRSNGVVWPRDLAIAENGAPYFSLHIESFRAEGR